MVNSNWLIAVGALALSGCTSVSPSVLSGDAANTRFPAASTATLPVDYRIGPEDVLRVTVFQEKDLSFEEVPVDASGEIVLPLIGAVHAAGRSSTELSQDVAARLKERYLVDPQVSIAVVKAAVKKITVEGAVAGPGIFEIDRQANLLQAMALARGPTSTAKLDEVIVFRSKPDGLYAARFNVSDIRSGNSPNPEILGNDIIVVGDSFAKHLFSDFIKVSPMLATVWIRLRGN